MANLIEQMDVLKGLTDEHLQAELKAPSGSAPPFLVATEVSRRKGMRERYAAEQARRTPQTTVLDDLTNGSGGGAPQGGLPAAMNGEAPPSAMAPMGQMGAPPPTQSFASGGIVDAVDYNDIAKRYTDRLAGLGDDKDRARAMALLAASGAILGGGHSNTLQNLGPGISAFSSSYGDALKTIDSEELNLLRGTADIGQMQHQDELAQLDRDFRERQLRQDQTQFDTRIATDKTPADILKFREYEKMSPEEKAAYSQLNPPYNPNALNNDQLIGAKTDAIYQDTLKGFPIQSYDTPEIASEKMRKAQIEAYKRIKGAYGLTAANDWAAGMGIAAGDILLLDTPGAAGAPANGADPLQLGL